MSEDEQERAQSLRIEKQKTLRLLILVTAVVVLGSVAMYIVFKTGHGSVKINPRSGEVELVLDKPVAEQLDVETSTVSYKGDTIQITEGRVQNPAVVEQLKNLSSSQPNQFSGKNFINQELRFFLTVPHPEHWQVSYNSNGLRYPTIPVNTIYNKEGSHLNIGVSTIPAGMDIRAFVTMNLQQMMQSGIIQEMPFIEYDIPSQTAFAIFSNPTTLGQSYMKVVINRNKNQVFVASANYNYSLSSPEAIQELVTMIATFTLF